MPDLGKALTMEEEDFEDKYAFPKPSPSDSLIFTCQSGGRAQTACKVAEAAGYSQCAYYGGSWSEWSAKQQGTRSTYIMQH